MRSQNEERTQIFVIWSNYSGIDLYLWERRHPWRQACSRRQGWRRSRLSSYVNHSFLGNLRPILIATCIPVCSGP